MPHPHEKKIRVFPALTTKIDAALGIVEAIVSVFGILDDGNDVVLNGAFAKTIVENGRRVKVVNSHNIHDVLYVVGKPLAMREIGRDELPDELLKDWPEATGGLWTQTQYLIETPEGLGVFKRIEAGVVNEYSFMYETLDADYKKIDWRGQSVNARLLKQVKLYEFGPVVFGMNPATMTTGAKGATPFHELPLAARGRAWDASAAEKRVREWAGGDKPDWAKYRQAFFWYDGDKAEDFTGYKLQYADVLDGKLTAIPRGIFAAAAVLQGSRGGTTIPDADQEKIKGVVEKWYQKMASEFDDDSITAPWAKAGEAGAQKFMDRNQPVACISDYLQAQMRQQVNSTANYSLLSGNLTNAEHKALHQALDAGMKAFHEALPADLAQQPVRRTSNIYYDRAEAPEGMKALDRARRLEGKAGRMLSGDSAQSIQDALTAIEEAAETLEALLEAAGVLDPASDEDETEPAGDASPDTPNAGKATTQAGPGAETSATPPTDDERRQVLADIQSSMSSLEALRT